MSIPPRWQMAMAVLKERMEITVALLQFFPFLPITLYELWKDSKAEKTQKRKRW